MRMEDKYAREGGFKELFRLLKTFIEHFSYKLIQDQFDNLFLQILIIFQSLTCMTSLDGQFEMRFYNKLRLLYQKIIRGC